jgi:hypothetical protein
MTMASKLATGCTLVLAGFIVKAMLDERKVGRATEQRVKMEVFGVRQPDDRTRAILQ